VFFDELQVLYHAHPVAGLVSFVDGSQPVAWEAFAFKTEVSFPFGQFGAMLLQKGALLVPRSAAYAVDHSDPFALHVMFMG